MRQKERPTAEAPQWNTPKRPRFNRASGERGGGRGGFFVILCPETGQRITVLRLAGILNDCSCVWDLNATIGQVSSSSTGLIFCFAAPHRKANNQPLRALSDLCLPG